MNHQQAEDTFGAVDRAASRIPGKSLTRSKAPGVMFPVGAGPQYVVSAHGCLLRDVRGGRYIDMLCGLGAISLGYEDQRISVGRRGQVYSLPHVAEGEAADAVLNYVAPWAERVRFVKTGSEATHAALLIACLHTGRRRYARLRGSYHGWHTEWRDDAPAALWFELHEDATLMRTLFADCAAVFVEPPRWQALDPDWLRTVVATAHDAGALVVFDEMIYGGRWALGGASEYYQCRPDLACYGKALGNGYAAACVVGAAAVMDGHATAVSGTYSGEVTALGAVVETVLAYQQRHVIDTLWARGRQLQRGLRAMAADWPGCVTVEGAPVHQRLAFHRNRAGTCVDGVALGQAFAAAMAQRGVLWHPACVNVMEAHTPEVIETVVVQAEDALRAVIG